MELQEKQYRSSLSRDEYRCNTLEYNILDTAVIERLISQVEQLKIAVSMQSNQIDQLKQRLETVENAIRPGKSENTFIPSVAKKQKKDPNRTIAVDPSDS